ncbi:hypothetical protein SY2F82_15600 [Streptomyces sp. Y2F8-2]|nr:hypothetical protein SY2F82_15600 [Streptomyces sp. Y2F8-2]
MTWARSPRTAPSPNLRHLAFGCGVHYCVGAPSARLEASVALPALFDRFPEPGPDGEVRQVESFIVYGYEKIPVPAALSRRAVNGRPRPVPPSPAPAAAAR